MYPPHEKNCLENRKTLIADFIRRLFTRYPGSSSEQMGLRRYTREKGEIMHVAHKCAAKPEHMSNLQPLTLRIGEATTKPRDRSLRS